MNPREVHWLLLATMLLLITASPAGAYTFNGFKWGKAYRPVKYYINEKGSTDLGAETFTIVQQSMAVWDKVGCSDFRWKYMGKTKVGTVMDLMTVIAWEEKKWVYGPYAAAATSLAGKGEQVIGDIAFNGVDFKWKKGGGSLFSPFVVDPASVIVHEAGHLLGLSHTSDDQVATMGHAYVPGANQKTLGLDDKLGICHLYPADKPTDECTSDCDCPKEAACKYVSSVKAQLCVEFRDPVNAPCSAYHINCSGHCAYYDLDVFVKKANGLCTVACSKEGETCANGWTCVKNTTNLGQDQLVCLAKKPKPDAPPKFPYNCKKDAGVPDVGLKDATVSVDAPGGEEEEESSCRVGGAGSTGTMTLLGLLLLGLLARRRERPL